MYRAILATRTPFGHAGEEVVLDDEIVEAYGEDSFSRLEKIPTDDTDPWTVKTLQAKLEELSIEFPKNAKKDELLALLTKHSREPEVETKPVTSADNTALQSPHQV